MNRYLKQEMKKLYEVSVPNQREKARFLRELSQPQLGMWQFILIQIAYLRKRVLMLSVLLLFPALAGARYLDPNTVWIVSALIPFLSLLAVAESTRSTIYEMHEFEMSTRFSLKSVMLARMSILGFLDLFVLCCLVPLCYMSSDISFVQTGVYLLVPYLITTNICLKILRYFHGKEAFYSCMGLAVLISGINWGLHIIVCFLYEYSYICWWLILSAFLIGKMVQEVYYTVKQTEELAWNL